MKKLAVAMVLVLGGLTNACAVDAGGESGEETADESTVIQEEAEALMSARDICMGRCGNKYGSCSILAQALPEPEIEDALDQCYANLLNCASGCERKYPIVQ